MAFVVVAPCGAVRPTVVLLAWRSSRVLVAASLRPHCFALFSCAALGPLPALLTAPLSAPRCFCPALLLPCPGARFELVGPLGRLLEAGSNGPSQRAPPATCNIQKEIKLFFGHPSWFFFYPIEGRWLSAAAVSSPSSPCLHGAE